LPCPIILDQCAAALACPQTFGPQLAAQIAEPLQFVDYLREPKRDEVRAAGAAVWPFLLLCSSVTCGVAVRLTWVCRPKPATDAACVAHAPCAPFAASPCTLQTTGEVVEARPSCYESVPGGMEEVRRRVEAFMQQFNEGSRAMRMELVLFKGEGEGAEQKPALGCMIVMPANLCCCWCCCCLPRAAVTCAAAVAALLRLLPDARRLLAP